MSSLTTPKHPRFVVYEKHLLFHVVFAKDEFLIEDFCAAKKTSPDFFLPCLVISALRLSAPAGCTNSESSLKRWSLYSENVINSSLLTLWLNELYRQQQQNETGASNRQSWLAIRTVAILVLSAFHDSKTCSTLSADLLKTYLYYTKINVAKEVNVVCRTYNNSGVHFFCKTTVLIFGFCWERVGSQPLQKRQVYSCTSKWILRGMNMCINQSWHEEFTKERK